MDANSSAVGKYVPIAAVMHVWPRILPHLQKSEKYMYGEYTPDDLLDFALKGAVQMWHIQDDEQNTLGVVFTEICSTPLKRWVQVFFLAGIHGRQWIPLVDQILEEIGIGCEAQESRQYCRPGFSIYAKQLGYTARQIVFVREIGDGSRRRWKQ